MLGHREIIDLAAKLSHSDPHSDADQIEVQKAQERALREALSIVAHRKGVAEWRRREVRQKAPLVGMF